MQTHTDIFYVFNSFLHRFSRIFKETFDDRDYYPVFHIENQKTQKVLKPIQGHIWETGEADWNLVIWPLSNLGLLGTYPSSHCASLTVFPSSLTASLIVIPSINILWLLSSRHYGWKPQDFLCLSHSSPSSPSSDPPQRQSWWSHRLLSNPSWLIVIFRMTHKNSPKSSWLTFAASFLHTAQRHSVLLPHKWL